MAVALTIGRGGSGAKIWVVEMMIEDDESKKKKMKKKYGPDTRTNRRTDGQTHPFIESLRLD